MPSGNGVVDVFLLPLLGSATEQNDDCFAILSEIDAVTWAKINPILVDAGANALGVREISKSEAIENCGHLLRRLRVQEIKPLAKRAAAALVQVLTQSRSSPSDGNI